MDVTVIGLKTVGKDEGSLILYDKAAPYTWNENPNDEKPDPNPNHKKAIQPIVTKIVNSEGADYPDGFAPDGYTPNGCVDNPNDNCVIELTRDNLLNKPKLGSTDEPLFSRAIDIIVGQQAKRLANDQQIKMEEVQLPAAFDSFKPHRQGMHVEPFMVPTIEK
jgi:hypothetical protein